MRRSKGSLLLISILFVLALVIVIWLVGGKTEGMASNSDTCISKVIIQTSRDSPPSQTVLDNFKAMMPDDWTYQHFTDADIKQFFLENPLDEFPDIQAKFDAMPYGQHKADLFRYYYIYAKGGVFVDSDARIEQPIDQLCQDVSFFSVRSKVPETIFQGFIGACPQNEIMYRVLKHAYTTDPSELAANYHLLTGELYRILENEKFDFKIKLFQEEDKEYEPDGHYKTFDMDTGKLVLIHYPMSKNVPPLGT
jgi:hypothetical protein